MFKFYFNYTSHLLSIGALSSPPQSDPPAVHMLLLIDEATVTIKAVQNPPAQAFFSKKKPQSSPAMRVVFKGCHGRFSVDSKSKFFGVYQGFMGVEAYIIGKCMCSKFGDSSSKQSFTSLDSGMQHLENVTEVGQLIQNPRTVTSGYFCSSHTFL